MKELSIHPQTIGCHPCERVSYLACFEVKLISVIYLIVLTAQFFGKKYEI